jgi:hypothetical protein
MKRIIAIMGATLAYLLVTATSAFAGSELPPPGGSQVLGETVTPPGAGGTTAFTGSDVIPIALAVVVLLALGIALVIAGRRRTVTAS